MKTDRMGLNTMDTKLLQIKTADGLTLPGLLYSQKSDKVAIHLHGNGSCDVFYHDDRRDELAKILNDSGISLLLFNNRGANFIKKLDVENKGVVKRKLFGMAYEQIKECIQDIDGALATLRKLGYKEFYLIGESTGANKICVYNYYKPKNKISKYVLLGGGDDTGIYYDMLGSKKFLKLLNEAKNKIKRGKGEELVTQLLPNDIFAWTGFYDISNPDGDYNVFPFLEYMKNLKLSNKPLFRHFKSIAKPTLVVYGGEDKYAWEGAKNVVNILKKQHPHLDYKIISGADHGFSGHQKALGNLISNWLRNR